MPQAAPPSSLPAVPPLSDFDMRSGEKEVLGYYVHSHPLAEHAGLLAAEVSRLAPVALIRKGQRFALVPFDATAERRQELLTALEK